MLASGFDFLPENPNQILDKLRSLIQEKEGGNDSRKLGEELVVIIEKSLEKKCNTTIQLKNILNKFQLI